MLGVQAKVLLIPLCGRGSNDRDRAFDHLFNGANDVSENDGPPAIITRLNRSHVAHDAGRRILHKSFFGKRNDHCGFGLSG